MKNFLSRTQMIRASRSRVLAHRTIARRAFTLIEVLVALAIMMLLLVIILVPINMGLDLFHIGKARSEVQQANKVVVNQIATDLRQAIFVYPNEEMPGITDKSPYNGNAPYYQTAGVTTGFVPNISRLDMILPALHENGNVTTPTQPRNYIVTYYARRLDVSEAFDPYSNPIVLFRAQYAYRNDDPSSTNTAYLVNTSSSRYNGASTATWLKQSYGEPNLSSQMPDRNAINLAIAATSHIQITPRDMALIALSATDATPSYQPDSSFICDDTNDDGKIDRVTISIGLRKYDQLGAAGSDSTGTPRSQNLRLTQTVDLPNVK